MLRHWHVFLFIISIANHNIDSKLAKGLKRSEWKSANRNSDLIFNMCMLCLGIRTMITTPPTSTFSSWICWPRPSIWFYRTNSHFFIFNKPNVRILSCCCAFYDSVSLNWLISLFIAEVMAKYWDQKTVLTTVYHSQSGKYR